MKGLFSFAVATASVVATALPACGSSKNDDGNRPDAAHDAGAGGRAGAGDASASDASSAGGSAPTSCTVDGDCTPETECQGGECVSKAVCPAGLEATFDSLRTNIFSVSCGTSGGTCHSKKGSVNSAGLDLADDPYTALLGADGKGAPAANIAGSVRGLVRVVPGDPDHSFLVIKLGTHTGTDPKYGSGMPFTDPGSVCPDTLTTIRAWISAGAAK